MYLVRAPSEPVVIPGPLEPHPFEPAVTFSTICRQCGQHKLASVHLPPRQW